MGLKERIAQKESDAKLREQATLSLFKNDKEFRADRLVEAYSKIPEIGAGIRDLDLNTARNLAINLDREVNFIKNLKESQLATALNDFTPENMLRLVRMSMPNIIRSQVFTEFALETMKDSIKYIRPFFAKTANGHPLNDKAQDYNGFNDKTDPEYDPWGYNQGGEFNGNQFRKALYEDTRDRAPQELANAIVVEADDGNVAEGGKFVDNATEVEVALLFKAVDSSVTTISQEAIFASQKWGKNGANYIDGYVYVYGANEGDNPERIEQQVIALQDANSGQFFAAPGFTVTLDKAATVRDKFYNNPPKIAGSIAGVTEVLNPGFGGNLPELLASTGSILLTITPTADAAEKAPWLKAGTKVLAYGRYNSESDFEGNYLGEVEIRMEEYTFKPSPTTIGVSWSQLTEITLDTSFNISAEEYLVSYASQEIRAALDYRAFRLAYGYAKTNGNINPNYIYHFDAAYNTSAPAGPATGTKEGYIENAQTFVSAISAVTDVIYDDLNRGGVSRLVAGPSACAYMQLMRAYNPKGKTAPVGSHKFGELDSIPLFKVPSNIIPTNEVLTVWKNDQVENDVSIAFGTLIPFFSTGIIARKNFYKEAGIATYGDWKVLNRRYLALIIIDNLKDFNQKHDVVTP